jgi:uncharacterized repeat protein (TIGR03803 family)
LIEERCSHWEPTEIFTEPWASAVQTARALCLGSRREASSLSYTIFCSETSCWDGSEAAAGLIQASDGDFYGVTGSGGIDCSFGSGGCGTIFKITKDGILTTLHRFNGVDGQHPFGALIQASNGLIYGTTLDGGNLNCLAPYGCGTVFRITLDGALTTLYAFSGPDGSQPEAQLTEATDGNLYGPTAGGGEFGWGTMFRTMKSGTLTNLHSFNESAGNPSSPPIQGSMERSTVAPPPFMEQTSGQP